MKGEMEQKISVSLPIISHKNGLNEAFQPPKLHVLNNFILLTIF